MLRFVKSSAKCQLIVINLTLRMYSSHYQRIGRRLPGISTDRYFRVSTFGHLIRRASWPLVLSSSDLQQLSWYARVQGGRFWRGARKSLGSNVLKMQNRARTQKTKNCTSRQGIDWNCGDDRFDPSWSIACWSQARRIAGGHLWSSL